MGNVSIDLASCSVDVMEYGSFFDGINQLFYEEICTHTHTHTYTQLSSPLVSTFIIANSPRASSLAAAQSTARARLAPPDPLWHSRLATAGSYLSVKRKLR